ncbi:MAG: hypothetical protein JNM82_11930 [Rhodocyclaceae bacterium]|nr:hypothetical protein [Rhodocyclaceae bacterium]
MKPSRAAALAAAILLAGPARGQGFAFGLFGDLPYTRYERQHLPDLLAEMGREALAFAIHDGDIKSGGSRCDDETFQDILAVFRDAPQPLVYVPGDNEWVDCHRPAAGRYDPEERLARLRALFFAGEESLGRRRIHVERQSRNPAFVDYRENMRWERDGIAFLTLNLPGSQNNFRGPDGGAGPSAEFMKRAIANRAWIADAFALARRRHSPGMVIVIQGNPGIEAFNAGEGHPGYRDFLAQLLDETRRFPGQVVLVHGDTHLHRIDHPLLDPLTRAPVTNFRRVETFGSPFMGWVKGWADAASPEVFRFEARPYRPAPQQ